MSRIGRERRDENREEAREGCCKYNKEEEGEVGTRGDRRDVIGIK